MISSERGARGFAVGPFVACPRCEASVKFPAKYCDMCGGRLAQDVALDFVFIPEQAAQRQEERTPPVIDAVAVRDDDSMAPEAWQEDQPLAVDDLVASQPPTPSRVDSEAACRALRAAYMLLKGNQRWLESLEASANPESFGKAVVGRITSYFRMRPEIAELHRTLDLVLNEASKASGLDPEAVIETDDGLLNVSALLSRADRTRGHIEVYAGMFRRAIRHYQSSLDKLETQDAYFDMAVAYERIGQPGKALRAYENCGEIVPDSELGVDALEIAEELRSQRVMGGWFLGSWTIVIVLGVCALSGLVILPMSPLAGLLNFALWGATLGVYCLLKFRFGGGSQWGEVLPRSVRSHKYL